VTLPQPSWLTLPQRPAGSSIIGQRFDLVASREVVALSGRAAAPQLRHPPQMARPRRRVWLTLPQRPAGSSIIGRRFDLVASCEVVAPLRPRGGAAASSPANGQAASPSWLTLPQRPAGSSIIGRRFDLVASREIVAPLRPRGGAAASSPSANGQARRRAG